MASSRLGVMTTARGRPGRAMMWSSSSSRLKRSTTGRRNESVFPLPVGALITAFSPRRIAGITSSCAWGAPKQAASH